MDSPTEPAIEPETKPAQSRRVKKKAAPAAEKKPAPKAEASAEAEKPKRKRAPRTKKKAAKAPAESVAPAKPVVEAPAPAEAVAEEKPRKPRRRRRGGKRVEKTDAPTTPATETVAEPTPVSESPASESAASSFADLGLTEPLLSTLAKINFKEPTDIQRELIPQALKGADCLGQARTGTGKTAAFALPVLQKIKPGVALQCLVLVPTRELASQVNDVFMMLGKATPLKTALLYGGRRITTQLAQLKKNPEIVIGTPGRILDMMRRKQLSMENIRFAILDEIDRMLDIGFRDDIRRILRHVEGEHQTLFVSATLDEEIRKLAKAFMKDEIEINVSGDELTVTNIEHGFVPVAREDKFSTLLGFIKHAAPTLAIVFTNTKHNARRVAEKLKKEGVNCQEIHGDLHQTKREKVMSKFRKSAIQILVATDLASRGLDVMEVSHIVNYDVPEDPAVYVHRIGRTARMGQAGYAVTFVTPEDGDVLTAVEMLINRQLPRFDAPWLVRTQPPAPVAPSVDDAPAEKPIPARFRDTLRNDPVLDAMGIRPQKRTLGSRFRSARKSRR